MRNVCRWDALDDAEDNAAFEVAVYDSEAEVANDLTSIPFLRRSDCDTVSDQIPTIAS
jgi:hypothetical protein